MGRLATDICPEMKPRSLCSLVGLAMGGACSPDAPAANPDNSGGINGISGAAGTPAG